MLPHSQGNAEHAQDRFQTAARNLHQNYAYEKLRDRRLMEYAISPLANTPPEEQLAQPGIGFGYMRVATPAQLHANGIELESYLRGAGTKALEGRGADGPDAYAAVRVSAALIPVPTSDPDARARKFREIEEDGVDFADENHGKHADPLLTRAWVRSHVSSSSSPSSSSVSKPPLPMEGADTFRPLAPAASRDMCIIA